MPRSTASRSILVAPDVDGNFRRFGPRREQMAKPRLQHVQQPRVRDAVDVHAAHLAQLGNAQRRAPPLIRCQVASSK